MARALDDPQPGRFSHFEILERIGHGGMAVVYGTLRDRLARGTFGAARPGQRARCRAGAA